MSGADELPVLVRAINRYDGDETPKRHAITRAAPMFTLLTWARTSETALRAGTSLRDWTVPSRSGG